MAIALVVSTNLVPSGASGGTTPAIDTTGSNLIVIGVAISIAPLITTGLSDSNGNTWTLINQATSVAAQKAALLYCLNPTVGAGHTFTLSLGATFGSMCVYAFSGVKTSAALDQQNTNVVAGSGTTIQPGSVTPTANGSLIVTELATAYGSNGATISIDSGFATPNNVPFSLGTYYGSALSYLVQGAAGAVNPTWTSSAAGNPFCAAIATFLPAPTSVNVNLTGVNGAAATGSVAVEVDASVTLAGVNATAAFNTFGATTEVDVNLSGAVATSTASAFSSYTITIGMSGVSATSLAATLINGTTINLSQATSSGLVGFFQVDLVPVIFVIGVYTIMRNNPVPASGLMSNDVVACQGDF